MITVQTVVEGLIKQGYKELGGSDVFRILRGIKGDCVKVYYTDYDKKDLIVVRESIEGKE
jgi:hypothetical protein